MKSANFFIHNLIEHLPTSCPIIQPRPIMQSSCSHTANHYRIIRMYNFCKIKTAQISKQNKACTLTLLSVKKPKQCSDFLTLTIAMQKYTIQSCLTDTWAILAIDVALNLTFFKPINPKSQIKVI